MSSPKAEIPRTDWPIWLRRWSPCCENRKERCITCKQNQRPSNPITNSKRFRTASTNWTSFTPLYSSSWKVTYLLALLIVLWSSIVSFLILLWSRSLKSHSEFCINCNSKIFVLLLSYYPLDFTHNSFVTFYPLTSVTQLLNYKYQHTNKYSINKSTDQLITSFQQSSIVLNHFSGCEFLQGP